ADFGPRAVPLIKGYASLLGSPDLVLHATDPVFDLSFEGLPERHHYVAHSASGNRRVNDPPTSMSRETPGSSSRSAPRCKTTCRSLKRRWPGSAIGRFVCYSRW